MSTAVHGPGDPGPQTPNAQAEVENDDLGVDSRPEASFATTGIVMDTDDFDALEEAEARIGAAADPDEPVLFDRAPYRTPTPHFDDLASDKLLVLFGGGIEYDPTNPDHIEEFEALTLGRPVTITVAGYVQAKTGTYKETAEGAVTVTGKAQIKIDSILPKA